MGWVSEQYLAGAPVEPAIWCRRRTSRAMGSCSGRPRPPTRRGVIARRSDHARKRGGIWPIAVGGHCWIAIATACRARRFAGRLLAVQQGSRVSGATSGKMAMRAGPEWWPYSGANSANLKPASAIWLASARVSSSSRVVRLARVVGEGGMATWWDSKVGAGSHPGQARKASWTRSIVPCHLVAQCQPAHP